MSAATSRGLRPSDPTQRATRAERPAADLQTGGAKLRGEALRTLVRHQLGALAATIVDFGTLVLLVQVFGVDPVPGTAIGASLGALTNFTLSRLWVFAAPAHDHAAGAARPGHAREPDAPAPASLVPGVSAQALRYALVSGASLLLNTLGEHLAHGVAHVQYVLARLLVALVVSLAWNYPLHRFWVFARR